ncbi:cyclic nucleotide-binding domain-containing protein [Pedobacter sp. LMG 31464]|uniref:Cyclic nucleotide-binding domain-containing protein n=1 Tax=Pedobacter planticolens TaxID=2679964 RepID=A0A923E1F3_9SPHI|nr:Crp/Fnr family transcriptional regulator [Pedobacter planticolens]MBB2146495.1 cyclic nucleotide-binding domain-containing protein [Pedobacter planticolens]
MPNENLYPEHESLFNVFNSIYPLSDELKKAIVNESNIIHVEKKTQLLNAGETSNNIYFINKGAARVYYLDKEGAEITSWFLFENELLISVYSFFTGLPGFEYLETLENSTLIVLKREKLNKLYEKYLDFNFIGRKLTEFYYIRNEIQANELRVLTAKQRYQRLLTNNPKLLNRVSLGHIASYLGISQETLSRIRKQI